MANQPTPDMQAIKEIIHGITIPEALNFLSATFPGQVVFSTSFSYEDQVISHLILSARLNIAIFTLDTGRLFPETYSVWNSTNERYQTNIKAYYPEAEAIQAFVTENGPNAFYESVEKRKECCYIRKVVPLKKALKGNKIWITGLRAEHSAGRSAMEQVEWDEGNEIIKYNPVLWWTAEEIKEFINKHTIPYNPLHDKGFVSIGCAPCTRAVQPGEDFRAGRWWWEDKDKKECGLHVQTEKK